MSSCFCFHDKPPLEDCQEDQHFWNFVEGNPTFHFDLKCSKCDTVVKFDELVGLMVCVGCDERCDVNTLRQKLEREAISVCIALGRWPVDERKQLPQEKIDILQEYFDRQSKSLKSKIRVVSHQMVRSIDSCYAEVVQDAEALFKTAVNKNRPR